MHKALLAPQVLLDREVLRVHKDRTAPLDRPEQQALQAHKVRQAPRALLAQTVQQVLKDRTAPQVRQVRQEVKGRKAHKVRQGRSWRLGL